MHANGRVYDSSYRRGAPFATIRARFLPLLHPIHSPCPCSGCSRFTTPTHIPARRPRVSSRPRRHLPWRTQDIVRSRKVGIWKRRYWVCVAAQCGFGVLFGVYRGAEGSRKGRGERRAVESRLLLRVEDVKSCSFQLPMPRFFDAGLGTLGEYTRIAPCVPEALENRRVVARVMGSAASFFFSTTIGAQCHVGLSKICTRSSASMSFPQVT